MKALLTAIGLLLFQNIYAQQNEAITDSMPYSKDGLEIGYRILTNTTKEVGDKGDFSRFEINCFLMNKTEDPKIIFYKSSGFWGSNENESSVDDVVKFECLNATGARLTSKTALLEARACFTEAWVDEKDCTNGKTIRKKKSVQIGYFIPPGATISKKIIVIVPLNQKPDFRISLLKDFSI